MYGERYRHLGATSQYLMEKIVSVEADEPELLMRRLETIESEVLRSRPIRVCHTAPEPADQRTRPAHATARHRAGLLRERWGHRQLRQRRNDGLLLFNMQLGV